MYNFLLSRFEDLYSVIKKTIFFCLTAFCLCFFSSGFAIADSDYTNNGNEHKGKHGRCCHGCHGGHGGHGCHGNHYTLQSYDDLAFGKIVFPSHGTGAVYIEPRTGEKTLEGGVFDLGGHSSPAVFKISGEPGMQFEIVLPRKVRMRPKRGGVKIKDMSVWPSGVLRIDPTGSQEFRVGGRMYLPSGVKPGNYKARFSVFVNQIME